MDTEHTVTNTTGQDAVFSIEEARVLACLMEKELSVPDSYPLSLNSLTLACNQKSNREPRMELAEGEVGHIAKVLEKRGYVRIEYGERVHRFEHTMRRMLNLDKRQQSLLTVLMLRSPQTLNELKVRSKRMTEFADLDEVLLTLESLNERETSIVLHIPRAPGQREDRYTHLFCGEPKTTVVAPRENPAFTPPPSAGDERILAMQDQIEALVERVEKLESLIESE